MLQMLIAALAGGDDNFSAQFVENRGVITDGSELGVRSRNAVADERYREASLSLPTREGWKVDNETEAEPSASDWIPRTAEGYLKLEVLDLTFAAENALMRSHFEGKTIEFIGQYKHARSPQASRHRTIRFSAVRLLMFCCAADARPIGVFVEMESPLQLPEMTWVRVVGEAAFPIENGRRVPVVRAKRVESCPAPQEKFIF